jgi:hypothetical protein
VFEGEGVWPRRRKCGRLGSKITNNIFFSKIVIKPK